jgi:hypothetical protein
MWSESLFQTFSASEVPSRFGTTAEDLPDGHCPAGCLTAVAAAAPLARSFREFDFLARFRAAMDRTRKESIRHLGGFGESDMTTD